MVDGRIKNSKLPSHAHDAVSIDEFKIQKHFSVIKARVINEIHTWPSTIFEDEIKNLQTQQGVSAEAIGEYVKPYSTYKSGFDKMRAELKPKMPPSFEEFSFDDIEFFNYTQTVDKKLFLQYDNKSKDNRIMIFASSHGLQLLGESKRWKSDGTFFCAPKPFKQAYYILSGKPGEKL